MLKFSAESVVQVFIATQRSGAVGVNLTSANYIFLLEPLLNTALDAQAVGRAWRMGQKRPVVVKRLYIEGSVEVNGFHQSMLTQHNPCGRGLLTHPYFAGGHHASCPGQAML